MTLVGWSEGSQALLVAGAALVATLVTMAIRTLRVPLNAPDRLVAELRLAQVASLVLAFVAAVWLGVAAVHEHKLGTTLDVMIALLFFAVAATAYLREPREALTLLSIAFASHAVIDVLHRPGWLPPDIAPRWFVVGCAVVDAIAAGLCYLPMVRR
ncbi:MAG: hypothetical protein GEU99_04425 [Luteitalea sp.]|nr:hypothetical protein [Luteitalea sp.]